MDAVPIGVKKKAKPKELYIPPDANGVNGMENQGGGENPPPFFMQEIWREEKTKLQESCWLVEKAGEWGKINEH